MEYIDSPTKPLIHQSSRFWFFLSGKATMVIMLASFVVFRQIYLYVVANFISNTILPIAMGYPAGWLLCSMTTLIYYHHIDLGKNAVIKDA